MPLVLCLWKPLWARQWWLVNAQTLVNKLALHTMAGQITLTNYFQFLPISCIVVNHTLGPVQNYATDQWYFNMPLVLCLWKPLWARQWWLVNTPKLWSINGHSTQWQVRWLWLITSNFFLYHA
jgi:hypothetical protein